MSRFFRKEPEQIGLAGLAKKARLPGIEELEVKYESEAADEQPTENFEEHAGREIAQAIRAVLHNLIWFASFGAAAWAFKILAGGVKAFAGY